MPVFSFISLSLISWVGIILIGLGCFASIFLLLAGIGIWPRAKTGTLWGVAILGIGVGFFLLFGLASAYR